MNRVCMCMLNSLYMRSQAVCGCSCGMCSTRVIKLFAVEIFFSLLWGNVFRLERIHLHFAFIDLKKNKKKHGYLLLLTSPFFSLTDRGPWRRGWGYFQLNFNFSTGGCLCEDNILLLHLAPVPQHLHVKVCISDKEQLILQTQPPIYPHSWRVRGAFQPQKCPSQYAFFGV